MEKKNKDNLILVLGILILLGICVLGLAWYFVNKETKETTVPSVPSPRELTDDTTGAILDDLEKIDTGLEKFEQEFNTLEEDIGSL